MAPFSGVFSQIPHCKLITLDHFLLWKGKLFVLIRIGTSYEYGFAFVSCHASAATTIHEFCLIYCHGIPHCIASNQVNPQKNNSSNGSMLISITFYHVPQHPESVVLIDWWNDLLRTPLQHHLGGQYVKGCGEIL